MRRYLICVMMMCLLLAALPFGVSATETEAAKDVTRQPGQCGDDLTWSYDGGTLTISGSGAMDDYTDGDAPWLEYKDSIETVIFSGEVTHVGACAFTDYDSLTSVDFGDSMHTIHYRAFKSCDGLTKIYLPASFRRFGEESFMSCQNLTEIRCRGGMPSFNANCVWDTYASVFYPTNNPWPSELVMQLFQAFHGRVQFLMASPEELAPPSEDQSIKETQPKETEPKATEAVATVPETTEPEQTQPETTEPETVPVTEATEITEVPETAAVETTEELLPEITEETAPEVAPGDTMGSRNFSGVWFGLCLITGSLSLVLIGALIFRRRSY